MCSDRAAVVWRHLLTEAFGERQTVRAGLHDLTLHVGRHGDIPMFAPLSENLEADRRSRLDAGPALPRSRGTTSSPASIEPLSCATGSSTRFCVDQRSSVVRIVRLSVPPKVADR